MSLAYLTLDLIKRLLRSNHPGAPRKLRDEVKGLVEVGTASWLPEEFQSGADAYAFIDAEVDQAGREKLRMALIEVAGEWAADHAATEQTLRGILGCVIIMPKLSVSRDVHWPAVCSQLWSACHRSKQLTNRMALSGYSLGAITNGFAWLTAESSRESTDANLAFLVGEPSQNRAPNWAEQGLHFLYAFCSHRLEKVIPQKALAQAFEQWINSLAAYHTSNTLVKDHVLKIQNAHAPDGRRLHHLLYRTWINAVPALSSEGMSSDSFNWLASLADEICRVQTNEGAFTSANKVLRAMLRKMPRNRINLVLQEQENMFSGSLISPGNETATSESYQVTKRICLNQMDLIDVASLEPLDGAAERAARLAPEKALRQFSEAA